MQYYLTMKKNESLSFVATQRTLRHYVSKMSKKKIVYDLIFM